MKQLHEKKRKRCDETDTTWQQREYRQEKRDKKKYSEKEREKLERAEVSGTDKVRRALMPSHASPSTGLQVQVSQYTSADREAEERRTSRAHLTVVLVSLS